MIFDILTIFPAMFSSPLEESIVGKARERGLIDVRVHNIRDYAIDKHQMTDDRPFGGGEGMVMKPEPIVAALRAIGEGGPPARTILLSPRGRLFNQEIARELSLLPRITLICGRYEGVDERVAEYYTDEQISIGDYILTGGELAAMILVDALTRLIPGALGNADSALSDSFSEPFLEYPQYTRPRIFEGRAVPGVLLSGNHEVIRRWRRGRALLRTQTSRPDLFARLNLSSEDAALVEAAREEFLAAEKNGGLDAGDLE
ncbi:MAG: tRNA (guanosine(37)-N1)-methyltransferase TrmD [Syntrophobacter sp.]